MSDLFQQSAEYIFLCINISHLKLKPFIESSSFASRNVLQYTLTMISYIFQVVLFLVKFSYSIVKCLGLVIYWTVWLLFHFVCGILGLEDRSTSALSWLLVFILVMVVYEQRCRHLCTVLSSPIQRLIRSVIGQRQHDRIFGRQERPVYTQAIIENQRNEIREFEPFNRRLEEENRENENEENSIVEADRNRIDFENRSNVQREYGSDLLRVRRENRQNLEREVQNTRSILENRRNQTQEQHRYFLRQRNRAQELNNLLPYRDELSNR